MVPGMREEAVLAMQGRRILHRRSWPVMSWTGIALVWLIYPFGVQASFNHGSRRDIWVVAGILLTVTALLRRVGSCRVVLLPEGLVVHNPLFSYQVARGAVRGVKTGSTGGLLIAVAGGKEIHPFSFGGSLVDMLFRTSERAADVIGQWLQVGPKTVDDLGREAVIRSVRRCWSADLALLCAFGAGTTALIVGNG